MHADRNRAVVGDRLEAEVARALEGEPYLGLEVGGEEPQLLEARALVVEGDVPGDLPPDDGGLKRRADVGPVRDQKRRQVHQDLALPGIANRHDREGVRHGMAEGIVHRARHRRARRGGEAWIDHPQLDPIALPVEANQIGAD